MRHEELTVGSLVIDGGQATGAAGVATLNQAGGVVTTEPLTTAANANYELRINNIHIKVQDMVLATVWNGTNTVGPVVVTKILPRAGFVLITIKNEDSVDALNGSLRVTFVVIKAG